MLAPSPSCALEIRGLVKRFARPAVDGLDLAVRAGEFYALLGPNGAGKTTTLRMIAGLMRPDAGSIHVAGIDALADPVAAKRLLAWISDEPMIYDKLTPRDIWNSSPGCGVSSRRWRRSAQTNSWIGSISPPTPMSAARDCPKACARRWRLPARWCTSRASSFSTSR
jgi:ABC-2 type transport system ATP-binding protein